MLNSEQRSNTFENNFDLCIIEQKLFRDNSRNNKFKFDLVVLESRVCGELAKSPRMISESRNIGCSGSSKHCGNAKLFGDYSYI